MTDEDLPLLDLLDDSDAREQRRTETIAVDVARRRWPIAVAAAAAALLIAGIVLAPGTRHDDSATTTSVNPEPRPSIAPAPSPAAPARSRTAVPPFIPGLYPDLPPAAATPSSPQTGELVASLARIHAGAWYLYADGRLIWIRDVPPSGGFVERRLTPEGVERVRSELLSSGLFDPDQPTDEIAGSFEDVFRTARVRDGGRLLSAKLPDSLMSPFSPPVRYFLELDASLPQHLWVDPQIKEYVASQYAFCVSRISSESTHAALPDPSHALALLPAFYAEVLGGRPTTQVEGIDATCFGVTRAEAGALGDAVLRSGWTLDVTQPIPMTVSLSIWALLPHGVPAIWGG